MGEKLAYLERTRLKLEAAKNVQERFEMKLYDQDFLIYPNVFNPNIFFGTEFVVEELIKVVTEFQPYKPKVLEIGTGAGYISIFAILNGASDVTCTDINRDALKNAEENINKYNMQDRITLKYSDVFNALDINEKFDIIIWNFPFGHVNKSADELEMLERAVMDPFYRSLDQYLKTANEYLNYDRGRLFLGFSVTAGDEHAFKEIANKYRWAVYLRNEIKTETTPVMHMGFYELKRTQ
jgi:methylase of polypeptide subunit release factors